MKIYEEMKIERCSLKEDMYLFCVTAQSFPNGIIEAFQKLESLDPSICERPFYGISFQNNNGEIIYKAAVAEIFRGEGKKYGCETFVIAQGTYLTITLLDFMKNLEAIPNAFKALLDDPRVDTEFPWVEWYKSNTELLCMVRIN
ncbi:MAG: hypothetical protein ACJ75J_03650 [Cytophagaceae bacterium]